MILNFANSATSQSSFQSLFTGINQLQLLLLLPLVGAYIPYKPLMTIVGISISLFNFSFMDFSNSPTVKSEFSTFSFKQYNSYLYLINMTDGSSTINLISMIGVSFFIPIFHALFEVSRLFIKNPKSSKLSKCIEKLHSLFTIGFYIRYFMEIYLLLLIT